MNERKRQEHERSQNKVRLGSSVCDEREVVKHKQFKAQQYWFLYTYSSTTSSPHLFLRTRRGEALSNGPAPVCWLACCWLCCCCCFCMARSRTLSQELGFDWLDGVVSSSGWSSKVSTGWAGLIGFLAIGRSVGHEDEDDSWPARLVSEKLFNDTNSGCDGSVAVDDGGGDGGDDGDGNEVLGAGVGKGRFRSNESCLRWCAA